MYFYNQYTQLLAFNSVRFVIDVQEELCFYYWCAFWYATNKRGNVFSCEKNIFCSEFLLTFALPKTYSAILDNKKIEYPQLLPNSEGYFLTT